MASSLEGISNQQTAFALGLGEMKMRKQMQDDAMRQMILDNLMQYLQTSYERRHAEKEQARRRQQQMVGKLGATFGSLGTMGALGAFGGATAGLDAGINGGMVMPNGIFNPGGAGYSPVGMIGY